MSKTKTHMEITGIQPVNGTDVDDTYQPDSDKLTAEQEDLMWSELHEQHLMAQDHRRMVELGHHNERGI